MLLTKQRGLIPVSVTHLPTLHHEEAESVPTEPESGEKGRTVNDSFGLT